MEFSPEPGRHALVRRAVDSIVANRWLQLLALAVALVPVVTVAVATLRGGPSGEPLPDRGVVVYDADWRDLSSLGDMAADEATSGIAFSGYIENAGSATLHVAGVRAELMGRPFEVTFASQGNCSGAAFALDPRSVTAIEIFIHGVTGRHLSDAAAEGVGFTVTVVELDGTVLPLAHRVDSANRVDHRAIANLSSACDPEFLR